MVGRKIWVLVVIVFLVLAACSKSPGIQLHYRTFDTVRELKDYLKWSAGKGPLVEAHRGGPMAGFPENALESFDNALKYAPCIIECDVRKTADGKMVLMHDQTLERTTTGSGRVSSFSLRQLKNLFLKDNSGRATPFRIPEFSEALVWARDKAILSLDVKDDTGFERVIGEVRKYQAEAHIIIIVYSLDDLLRVNRLAPDLVISAPAMGMDGARRLMATGVNPESLCAFLGVYEPEPEVCRLLHRHGIRTILGTMHNLDKKAAVKGLDVYRQLVRNGADILATDEVPAVAEALKNWVSTERVE